MDSRPHWIRRTQCKKILQGELYRLAYFDGKTLTKQWFVEGRPPMYHQDIQPFQSWVDELGLPVVVDSILIERLPFESHSILGCLVNLWSLLWPTYSITLIAHRSRNRPLIQGYSSHIQ